MDMEIGRVDLVTGSTIPPWRADNSPLLLFNVWRSLSGMQVELILNSLENSLSNSLQDKKYFLDDLWVTLKIAFSL